MNGPWAAAICGFLVCGGLFLLVLGLRRVPEAPSTELSTPVWTRARRWWTGLSKRRQRWIAAVAVAVLVAFGVTRWVMTLVLVPVLALGTPFLLATPPNRDLDLLEALDRWIRLLASALPTGRSIPDAVRSTLPMAPANLSAPLHLAVARLDDRWSFREAMLAMADDLASPDADAVIAALVLAAQRGGTGATTSLLALSESVQARLRANRAVETERAKPRIVVRQVTGITVTVLAIGVLTSPHYFAAYRTPVGQLFAVLFAAAFLGSLGLLRRRALPRVRQRILAQQDADGAVASSELRAAARQASHG